MTRNREERSREVKKGGSRKVKRRPVWSFELPFSPDALDSAVVTTNFRVEFYSVPLRHVVHKVNGADEAHHALAAASRQHFLGRKGRIYSKPLVFIFQFVSTVTRENTLF
jgi:hypothetical protein